MSINEEYFNSEDFRELLNSYEASIEAGDQPFMDADDLVDIADYYNQDGKIDEALQVIEYALELYPNATLPNVFMAREALMNYDFEEARRYADCIEEHDDPDYHYLMAEIMIAEGQIEKADRYLRDYGLTVSADEYQDFIKDCANLYIDYGISNKAYQWLMRSKGDDSSDFKELMGRILFGLGKYKDSERVFNELIDRNPYSSKYWKALSGVQMMNEDYSGAVTSSEYAIAIDPDDPEGMLAKANALFHLGNYEEAEKYYQRYSEANPGDDSGQMELVFCYSALKQPEKALQTLNQLEDTTADHADWLVVKGHILLENQQPVEAEKAFHQAIKESHFSPSIMLRIIVSLYDNRYIRPCYYMLKRFCELFGEGEGAYPESYCYMALCCHDLGYREEFLENLQKATEYTPKEAKTVLGFLFPPEIDVNDYYDYMTHQLRK